MEEYKVISSKEFGKYFAQTKFNEFLFLEIKSTKFLWNNFPEIYILNLKIELLRFHNYDRLYFDDLEEISLAAFIDEGYRLKEEYLKNLQLNNSLL